MDERQAEWLRDEIDRCTTDALVGRLLGWVEAQDPGFGRRWLEELRAAEPPPQPKALAAEYIERMMWEGLVFRLERLVGD